MGKKNGVLLKGEHGVLMGEHGVLVDEHVVLKGEQGVLMGEQSPYDKSQGIDRCARSTDKMHTESRGRYT